MADVTRTLLRDIAGGHRLTEEEAHMLMQAEGRDVWAIVCAADEKREELVGPPITYVRNQNINVTNICVNSCGFCGFSRKSGDRDAFRHDEETIRGKVATSVDRRVTEICTVSGLHPEFDAGSYIGIVSLIHQAAPLIHIHASNPMEVAYGARQSGISTEELLLALKDAGLGSMCGTAAEILVDSVRKVICPQKISTAEWVRIIREAHRLGIPTTATIMYGHCETERERVRHLSVLREIQDETGGFTEFVPLSFVHMNTPLFRKGVARAGATGREDILMIAVSRLFLDNIPHVQVSWVKMGVKLAQLGLAAGADDLGGTMFEESISKGAGAVNTDFLAPQEMERMAADLGRPLCQRTTLYGAV